MVERARRGRKKGRWAGLSEISSCFSLPPSRSSTAVKKRVQLTHYLHPMSISVQRSSSNARTMERKRTKESQKASADLLPRSLISSPFTHLSLALLPSSLSLLLCTTFPLISSPPSLTLLQISALLSPPSPTNATVAPVRTRADPPTARG